MKTYVDNDNSNNISFSKNALSMQEKTDARVYNKNGYIPMKELREGNRLIAEFMELDMEYHPTRPMEETYLYWDRWLMTNKLPYLKSYDAIMPVAQKILNEIKSAKDKSQLVLFSKMIRDYILKFDKRKVWEWCVNYLKHKQREDAKTFNANR